MRTGSREAIRLGRPVAIVNAGRTRGDELAAGRVEGRCEEVLPAVAERFGQVSVSRLEPARSAPGPIR